VATEEQVIARLKRRALPKVLTDEEAADALDQAMGSVRGYCGWHVWPSQEVTETVDGRGGSMVPVASLMVTDVAAVETRTPGDMSADAWSAAAGWDFSEGGWLLASGCWPDGPRTIRTTYTSGYDEVPDDIAAVLVGLAARTEKMPAGVSSESAGGESISYATYGTSTDSGQGGMLTTAERAILDRYSLENRP
jgi:hypothetical protein